MPTPTLKTRALAAPTDDGLMPAQRLNVVDKVLTFFNASYGVRAMVDRTRLHQFGYNDAPERRTKSGGLYANAGSETVFKGRDRIKAMWDARDSCQYDFIGGVMGRVALYVVGTLSCKSTSGDEQWDAMADADFHGWCGDEVSDDGTIRCDLTGRSRLIKLVQMAFLGHLIDGDSGLLEVASLESPTGEYCLQCIEADRIGSPTEAQVQENYVGGCLIDPTTGRVNAYRIFKRTRTNQYIPDREVPPSAFIHVFDPDRPDEYRGRTKLMRCLNDLRDIREWIEFEKMAGKTQSQFAALIGIKDPFNKDGPVAWGDSKTAAGTPTQEAMMGRILKLAEGETFNMLAPPNRPGGAFMQFVQTLIRKMSVSLDLPYGFLWDLASLGGVTARIEIQQALRKIQYWQQNIIVNKIVNRVRRNYIAGRIAIGALPPNPNWKSCEWHFGPWISTDAGYEMQADLGAINAGIIPVSMVTGKYGYNPQEVFVSNAGTANAAVNVGTEAMMPVEVFAKGLYPDITEQRAALIQGPPPPPKAGSLEAVGDKGTAQIIEILADVTQGKMERAAAVQAMQTLFGLTPKLAEAIVPQEPTPADMELLNPKPAAPNGNGNGNGNGKKKPKAKPKTTRLHALELNVSRLIRFDDE